MSCCLPLLLAGCSNQGLSPLGETASILWPKEAPTGQQAAAIPYASLSARLGDVGGLVVMGAQAGEMSYWPLPEGIVLELHDGGLHATAGFKENLLGTHYGDRPPWRYPAPARISLVRHWQDAEGQVVRGEADGRLSCDPAGPLTLPLGSRRLERCTLSLDWASGETTESILWRDPDSRRLWAVEETPWPGAPTLEWQVARHWW